MVNSGIDTDARWGFSHGKGWVFGYKLHELNKIQLRIERIIFPRNVKNRSNCPITHSCEVLPLDNLYTRTLYHKHHHLYP
jgi:hypothetical protein